MPEPVVDGAKNKIVRLFTYLEKALSLDETVVRDFRTTVAVPSPWWIGDLPHDVENLKIRNLETESVTEDAANDVLLRVEKKTIKAHPPLPKTLIDWVSNVNPADRPRANEKIEVKIRFDQDASRVQEFKEFKKDFEQGDKTPETLREWVVLSPTKLPEAIEERYQEELWAEHPELESLLADWIENEWAPWAENVRKIYTANQLYDQLYALRLLLKNEGDNYELLWGQGLLTWKHKKVGTVYAPLFLTPLTLDFDASKRVIEISPDPLLRGFVEISSLYEMENPAEMDLITWADTINSSPFDFWHLETLKSQSRTMASYISTDGEECFEVGLKSAPDATDVPSVWNAPVIFARKRNNDLWSKYSGTIRRDIEQNEIVLTDFITDLVGDYQAAGEATVGASGGGDGSAVPDTEIKESELFFPLPWNDEQKRIAERLDANYGVVVKGPPGTGKSHTIANLISRFLAQGKSVLVTSQTSKALEVLRNKLPENIRSLAVSQLHQTARRDDVLQQSIGEISSNLGERHTKFSEQKAEAVRTELRQVREEKALLASQIRKYILTDSSAKIVIDGSEIKPIDAAKLISKHAGQKDLEWFTDKIGSETVLNFNEEELSELYELLSDLAEDERGLHAFGLPDVSKLPNEDTVLGVFSAHRELVLRTKVSETVFGGTQVGLSQSELSALLDQITMAEKVLAAANESYEQEIFESCAVSANEKQKWVTVLGKLEQKVALMSKCSNAMLGHEISGNVSLPVNDLVEAVKVLKAKAGNSKIGSLGKMLLSAYAKKVLEGYQIDGRSPDEPERIDVLAHYVVALRTEKEISTLLEQGFSGLKSPPNLELIRHDSVRLEVLVSSLKRIVAYREDFAAIDAVCQKTKQLGDLSYTNRKDIAALKEIVTSQLAQFEMRGAETLLGGWVEALRDTVSSNPHAVVGKLISAIDKKNSAGWKSAVNELSTLIAKKEKSERLKHLTQKIKENAPNLYRDVVGLADAGVAFECPDNLELAWKLARLQSWLDHTHDEVDIDDLQGRLERLTKKEYQLNSDLVTVLAWQRQIDKVTKKQRDALMAWSLSMKKYGKGTGKYAATHLKAAQEALKEAKNAVPVWIMPLTRAAQMFSEPKAGMFDVVIFDEASQCDIRGINIGYLGKKLLVVGDPEQISPAGIFQNQEKVFELISRFLFDIPFKDSFSVTSSLFDIAKIRLSNMIQLNEHFRCVPDIIAFSNHHIYEGKLKPLRYPHPKGLLKPALVPVLVEDGYQNTNNKVNEPEAQAIVAKLVECLNDPNYDRRPDGRLCTFGIISLLAEDQAKHIEKLIRNLVAEGMITEKTIEERKIECGDAYKFQGDERDVILLSMVRAHDADKPDERITALVDESAKRRFNVAASRARDQMFLFHSIPLESLNNRDDWRYKLLSWFYDPKKEELKAGREALKREFDTGRASAFSFDVGNVLIDRGYQVLPEYPVIGYRIDLVIQGAEARLAVECDGDQYHTLENWEADQIREQQLRRAGWEFWRVTGSAYYRSKDKALESLWKKLKEMGIEPIVG